MILYLWFQAFGSADDTVDVVDGSVGLRANTIFRGNYGSTYLEIDEDLKAGGHTPRDKQRGSKSSLGLLSTHSSQDLSMGDVEAKSYQMLTSNDEIDDLSVKVTQFVTTASLKNRL